MIIIDQMGVELGKVLAKNILAQLDKPADVTGHDSSVSYLIVFFFVFVLADRRFITLLSILDYWAYSLLSTIQKRVTKPIIRIHLISQRQVFKFVLRVSALLSLFIIFFFFVLSSCTIAAVDNYPSLFIEESFVEKTKIVLVYLLYTCLLY